MDKKMKSAPLYEIFFLTMIAIAANLATSITGVLSYYLNNVVGFSVVIAGSFVTIFRIWDAVTDVGMGTVADRTKTKYGRFSPYMLIGAAGTVIVGQLMINVPPVLAEGAARKAGFIFFLYAVCRFYHNAGMRSSLYASGMYQRRKDARYLRHGERYLCHCLLYGGECIYLFPPSARRAGI